MNQDLLFKELSYRIQGIAYEVRNIFGPGLKEKIYQEAFEEQLKLKNISYQREKEVAIFSPLTGQKLGVYRPDFIVDGKIIVELKAQENFSPVIVEQTKSYLKNSQYELGYVINFSALKLYIKRIIYTNDRKH